MPVPLNDVADAILASRAADGDIRAFEALVRRYSARMGALARRLLGSNSDVDDVVQESFVLAWRDLATLADPGAFGGWLSRIVSRQCFDHLRSYRHTAQLADHHQSAPESQSPHQVTQTRLNYLALADVINALPDDQRRTWVLREVESYSYDDIAELLELPTSTVRGLLARARRTVLVGMGEWK